MIHIFSHLHVSPSAEKTAGNQSWMDPCVMWSQLHTKHTNICTPQACYYRNSTLFLHWSKKKNYWRPERPTNYRQFLNKQCLKCVLQCLGLHCICTHSNNDSITWKKEENWWNWTQEWYFVMFCNKTSTLISYIK